MGLISNKYNRNFRLFLLILIVTACSAVTLQGAPASPKGKNARKITVEKPDFQKIARTTLDPKSDFYFPKLIKLYNRNDTSMTKEQYRNLYLGYLFQEDYDPYRTSPYNVQTDSLLEITRATKARLTAMTDSLNKLIKDNSISAHEAEKKKEKLQNAYKRELRELSTVTELSLKDNLFDLRQMSILVHASKEMGNIMKAKIWEYRLENILGAIKSTGSGDSIDNPFYVIYPMHEYNMIQLLGYTPTSVDFPADGIDYITVTPDSGSGRTIRKPVEGFYFNVEKLTEQYELKHPEAKGEEKGYDDEDEVTSVETIILSPDEIPAE